MRIKTIKDIKVEDKFVFLRVDFNVPLKEGVIEDDTRIASALPTITYLLENGAKLIIASHLGKPKGVYNSQLSLKPVAKKLSSLLNRKVKFFSNETVVSEEVSNSVKKMKSKDVLLLENTRFNPQEEKNGEEFSKQLADLCEIFVDDAFGTVHREHASNYGITKFLDVKVCGFLVEKELNFLTEKLKNPKRKFVAILGGAKVSDKLKVINRFIDMVDSLIIGGAMAYTFLKAKGYKIGKSIVELDKLDYALEMIEKAKENNVKILLPVDHLVSKEFANTVAENTLDENIDDEYMGLDIGSKTLELFKEELKDALTVVWNGPMGAFEMSNYSVGTFELAKALSNLNALTIVGGGDSVSAINKIGLQDKISHISTGGGASLKLLEGEKLSAIEVLDKVER